MAGIVRTIKGIFQYGDEAARAGDRADDLTDVVGGSLDLAGAAAGATRRGGGAADDVVAGADDVDVADTLYGTSRTSLSYLDTSLDPGDLDRLKDKYPDIATSIDADPRIGNTLLEIERKRPDIDPVKAQRIAAKTADETSGIGRLIRSKKFRTLAIIGIEAIAVVLFLDRLGINEELIETIAGALGFLADNAIPIFIVMVIIYVYQRFIKKEKKVGDISEMIQSMQGMMQPMMQPMSQMAQPIVQGVQEIQKTAQDAGQEVTKQAININKQLPQMIQYTQPQNTIYHRHKIEKDNTSLYIFLGLFLFVATIIYYNPDSLATIGDIIPGVPGTGNCNSHVCPSNMKRKNLPELIKCGLMGCTDDKCCFSREGCEDCDSMCVLKLSENNWFPRAINIEPHQTETTNLKYPCIDKTTGIQKITGEDCTPDEHDLNIGIFSGLDLDGLNLSESSCTALNSNFPSDNIKFEYEGLSECLEDHENEGQGKCYPKCEFSMEGSLQAGFDRLINSDHISQVDPPCVYQPMKEYNDGVGVNDKYLFWGWSNSTNNEDVYSNADSIVYGKIDPACRVGQFNDFYDNDSTVRNAPKGATACIDRYDYGDPVYNSQNREEKFDIPGCARACAFDNKGSTKDIESGSDSGRRCNGFALKAYGTGDYSNTERTCLRIGSWPNNDETHNFRRYGAEGPDGGNVENCANECDTEPYSQDEIVSETKDAKVGATTMLYPYSGHPEGEVEEVNGHQYLEHYEDWNDDGEIVPWGGECRTLKTWDRTLLEKDPSKHDENNAKTPLYWPIDAPLDEQDGDRRPVFGTCEHLKDNMIHRKLREGTTFYQDQTLLNKRRPSRNIEKYTDGRTSLETKKFAVFERISE